MAGPTTRSTTWPTSKSDLTSRTKKKPLCGWPSALPATRTPWMINFLLSYANTLMKVRLSSCWQRSACSTISIVLTTRWRWSRRSDGPFENAALECCQLGLTALFRQPPPYLLALVLMLQTCLRQRGLFCRGFHFGTYRKLKMYLFLMLCCGPCSNYFSWLKNQNLLRTLNCQRTSPLFWSLL